ncbi:GNAT family N-acetyltransferase [Nocardioides ferulae]|uniref:GNAT family N-acetyltransferase n=1 Tax=Nocardioides ferulae TaxID=2340821 RepID=UPI0013DE6F51|nr:GNAT family N-acetyltransferase [Nocardioides ferulae]
MTVLGDDRQPATAPTLTDGVVTLRPPSLAFARGSYEQCQDPLSQRWTRVPVPYSMADAESYLGEVLPRGWAEDREWSFVLEHEGRYGGLMSLRNEGDGLAEVAYGSHPTVRGTGAVERGLRLLLEWGFAERDLHTVLWRANRGNWASRKVAWRLGFTVEGTVRSWLAQRGELRDGWVGTLLRDDPREPRTPWLSVPLLEGEGLRLRAIGAGDAERIQQACSEERTQRWLGQLPSPYSLDDAHTYIESRTQQLAEGTGVTWAVTEGDDAILGTIGWFDWQPGVQCEIGYWTHPDARGRGVMSRAMRLVTGHVVGELGVRRVTAYAAVDNTASRHVIESAGFRQFGVERLGANVREGRADLALYDLLADEWSSRR